MLLALFIAIEVFSGCVPLTLYFAPPDASVELYPGGCLGPGQCRPPRSGGSSNSPHLLGRLPGLRMHQPEKLR